MADHLLHAGVVDVLPLVEESLAVGKRQTVTGRVRIETVTTTIDEVVKEELHGENIRVQHVAINTFVEKGSLPPQVRNEGDVTIIPVLEEVIFVEKRLLLKEELHITREATTEISEIRFPLRKQQAVIQRLDGDGEMITEPLENKS